MTRLDRAAIIFVILVVLPQLFSHYPESSFDSGDDRRPLPPPSETAQPGPIAPPADRVRRPLADAAPDDPLFSVETETLHPGMVAIGTSFPIASGTWLTARHVANGDCQRIALVVDGHQTPAQIQYLHPNSDLALLQTPAASGPALPVESGTTEENETGFSFGFPAGKLGATEDTLMGRSRMQLGGHLGGVGPMLTWAEDQRYPDSLPSLGGMSGGPMLDQDGKVVGIMVAASVRRGRVHTVAPEVLRATEASYGLASASASAAPAQEVEGQVASLGDVASALSRADRIAKTYCLPTR